MNYHKEDLQMFREMFAEEYPYVALFQVSDEELRNFLHQDHIAKHKVSMQLWLCCDWCMAQQTCDVQE